MATIASRLPSVAYVYYHFRKFRLSGARCFIYRALRRAERNRVGKNLDPSAAIMYSQSVKTTEDGARSNAYGAPKNIKGRKRHLLVDALGFPLSVHVTPANVEDRVGALVARWAESTGAPFEEDLGGWGIQRRGACKMVRRAGRMGA